MAHWTRSLVLAVAESRWMKQLILRRGQWLVRRFVAGERIEDAIAVMRRLKEEGLGTILDLLGEDVSSEQEADAALAQILATIDAVAATSDKPDLAVKLTQLGLLLDEMHARQRMEQIAARARQAGLFVWIDMEQSAVTEATLHLYESLRPSYENVGIVLQAYLYRTMDDLKRLLPLHPKVRIVKGAYLEPPEVAYPKKADVDRNYRELVFACLQGGGRVAVATHDPAIIADVLSYCRQHQLAADRVEFQMLYGVRPDLQRALAQRGYRTLVYVPFGEAWYPYFSRRLAERPANIGFVLRSLLPASSQAAHRGIKTG